MLFIKGATTFSFFFNVEVSQTLQRICFNEQTFSVKLFAYAGFGYRTVSSFNNTKLEKLPNVKLLKLEISAIGLFCLFCLFEIQFLSK